MKRSAILTLVITGLALLTCLFFIACAGVDAGLGGGGSDSSVSSSSNISSSSLSNSSSSVSVSSASISSSSTSSVSSSSSSSAVAFPSDIKRVYTDRTEGTQLALDSSWEIWSSSVSLNPVTDGNDGGVNATACVKASQSWMGFVIKTSGSPEISNYNYLVFSLKISSDFSQDLQVAMGKTNQQYWYDINETRDDAWHTYVLDISTNDKMPDWAFAMRTSGGTWTTGTVRFDDIYYVNSTNHLTNFTVGTYAAPNTNYTSDGSFGLYTETSTVDVIWDTDAKMDIWNGFGMSSDGTTAGDGSVSLKIVYVTGAWGGLGMRVNPLTAYKDLSAFTNGKLKFMYKSSKNFTKVGITDGLGTERWVTGATCVSSYGMTTDDTWSTVSIPLSAFSGLDWTKIQQYFMFVADGANYVSGNVWNIDNIYFTNN